MDDKNKDRCKHPGCTCLAAKDSKYCSPHCETVRPGRRSLADVGIRNVLAKLIEGVHRLSSGKQSGGSKRRWYRWCRKEEFNET